MTPEYLLNNVLSFYKTTGEKSHSYNLILEYRQQEWRKALLAAANLGGTVVSVSVLAATANNPERLKKLMEESDET